MNLLTFPFYATLQQQSRFRPGGQVPRALPCGQNRWLPFALSVDAAGQGLDCVRIRRTDGSLYKVVPSTAFEYGAFSNGQQDTFFYYGGLVAGLNMPCDEYYLEVQGYFSEVFTVFRDTDQFLRLSWCNAGGLYQTGFFNLLFLDAVVAEPTYKTDEEGEEDQQGNFVALRVRVEKTLKLDTQLLPEFLVDALAGMALHTTKEIGQYVEANALKLTPTWNKKGTAATVELAFSDGAAATSDGCDSDAPLLEIDLSGFVPAACDASSPTWENQPETRCQQLAGKNTGWVETRQVDTNPLSPTHNTSRWQRTGYDTATCPLPAAQLRSKAVSDKVFRTNCNASQEPGFVIYTVSEGQFTGTDQAVIDQQALDYFEATRDAYANANAVCLPARRVRIDSYRSGAKIITVNLVRTDTAGDCKVSVFTQIVGNNGQGAGDEVYSQTATFTIPNGQTTLQANASQAGYVISEVQVVQIIAVDPTDYSF